MRHSLVFQYFTGQIDVWLLYRTFEVSVFEAESQLLDITNGQLSEYRMAYKHLMLKNLSRYQYYLKMDRFSVKSIWWGIKMPEMVNLELQTNIIPYILLLGKNDICRRKEVWTKLEKFKLLTFMTNIRRPD